MRSKNLDVLLISSPENVFYLSDVPTNFTAPNRLLFASRRTSPIMCIVPASGEPSLVFSAAAYDIINKFTWIKDQWIYATGTYIWRKTSLHLKGEDFLSALKKLLAQKLRDRSKARIGVELVDLSALNFEALRGGFRSAAFEDATPLLMESRMIKNDEEIKRFVKANDILCTVMRKIEDVCRDRPRPTELDLDILLKTELMKEGAQSWQQTTIAAGRVSGPDIYNQPFPARRIKSGDVIRLDIGCVYEGYCADLSRTFAVESVPPRAANVYKVLREAFEEYLGDIVPGTPASMINEKVVDYVRKRVDKNYYRGNVGHGVGVELYDKPILSKLDDTPFGAGMTLSYEVPYHIAGLCGLNLEDSVLVKRDRSEVVSSYSRDMTIV
jgi:Xaa-Pro aminopeptidase